MPLPLRPFQRTAIEALRKPGHLICVSPTGSGKSLIYERLIVENGWRTLIVSPLVALSRQQLKRLEDAGAGSETRILSPESLAAIPLSRLRAWRPEFLVVDECHCIHDWGETFRPAFTELPSFVRTLRLSRSLWLTATLPPAARDALKASLPPPVRELGTFGLPDNLHIHALQVPWSARLDALAAWTQAHPAPGIVFAPTRALTDKLANFLAEITTRQVAAYHAGLSREERLAIEGRLAAREVDLVIATSAFGLGVHHPHLRWTLLWQAPPSLLALAQFLGRAGRNAGSLATAPAEGAIFWDDEDFRLLEWTLQGSVRRKEDLVSVRVFLDSMRCRRSLLSEYFNGVPSPHPYICTQCDNCLRQKNIAS